MEHIIELNNLTKIFGKQKAVDNVDLIVGKKDIYGLVGRNGAGKSTLLKMILGAVNPTSGNIRLMGQTGERGLNIARATFGAMIEPAAYGYMTARQNVDYFRTVKGISDKKEVDRVLEIVGLNNVKKRFKQFSMGMKQRLCLAVALLGNPDVLLLDEPTNGLDPVGVVEFRDLILELNREHEITMILSSHILSELSLVATRFGFLEKGVLLKELTAEELASASQDVLLLQVSDAGRAVATMEEKLHTDNYKVRGDGVIELYDYLDAPDRVAKELVTAGIGLFNMNKKESNLEAYYMNLIGGEVHHV